MIDSLLAKVFGTQNEREIKAMQPAVNAINALEPEIQKLSDTELAAKTVEFKEKLANGATLDELLTEAFAVGREAGRRVLNMRHFDVQLIGGMVLHKGKIAEMRTGEGKTLVATLPTYLNALSGNGVHVVTVNDYLARRDAEWMGRLYNFLGLSTGIIVHDLDETDRRASYAAEITYGTNNEFGFDYLRDNMKFRVENCVQRGHNFAIVDEVDSILVDEARTPLIISGPSEQSTDKYYKVNGIIPRLVRGEVIDGKEPGEKFTTGDFTVDEKHRSVALTEEGVLRCEKLLGIGNMFEPANIEWNHHVQQALRAHVIFHLDKDYVVKDGEVIIVDEFTGRLMPGRRWSDGLHQAVEAKEGVKIERETQTYATISFQNYFRMYKKLAGMTGTAETEAAEFQKIYNLDVTVIPTNREMLRKEFPDLVYRTDEEKFRNAAKEIAEKHALGQPVLVGTISVEKSEKLGRLLKSMGIRHEVLNAKNHEREAFIISQAGRKGAVTVSTNMAGRGTDILLGGNSEAMAREQLRKQGKDADQMIEFPDGKAEWERLLAQFKAQTVKEHDEVVALGGLHILGTERHESRRIDNQLRGRAGRQGDPGSSRFYLSLQDDLLRVFGGERMQNLMLRLGMEEDMPIESGLITKRIAGAQKAVEVQNFEMRKHLIEYDDVMNKQRTAIYSMRRSLLEGEDQKERVMEMASDLAGGYIDDRCPENAHFSTFDLTGLKTDLLTQFGITMTTEDLADRSRDELESVIFERVKAKYDEKESVVGPAIMRDTERWIMLNAIDDQWKDHLLSMDHLKEGIGLRGYGQKDPLVEYKKESYSLFQELMGRIEDETVRYLFFLRFEMGTPPELPFRTDDEEYEEDDGDDGPERNGALNNGVPGNGAPRNGVSGKAAPANGAAAERERQQQAAQAAAQVTAQDLTRNIQRKKEKELAGLSFGAADAAATPAQTVVKGKKVGRNEICPCGSGKKYKNCHGATV